MKVKVGKRGNIYLPKKIREKFGIYEGMELKVEVEEEKLSLEITKKFEDFEGIWEDDDEIEESIKSLRKEFWKKWKCSIL